MGFLFVICLIWSEKSYFLACLVWKRYSKVVNTREESGIRP